MGKSLSYKIIEAHLTEGTLKAGSDISISIDQTLTQDATGTMVYLQFESLGLQEVKTEISVSYIDHNTLQSDFRNMDDHQYLQSAARKYGVYFSRPGNGICHQVHIERFGIPGKTLLGSDSHTPTGGGIGMLAIGAGGLDVAVAMASQPFYMKCPSVTGVRLTGTLPPMCSAKDIILALLKIESVKGGVGKIYEYHGSGVKTLSVQDRATITNMGAELGATTSLFPSDENTRTFLETQNRADQWSALAPDDDAEYDQVIDIDLSSLEPLAALPHMPDNVVPIREIAGKKIDQVAIGSCTNSSISDLAVAAEILKGKTVADNVSLGVSPGSRQVYLAAMQSGIIEELLASGARILESACGPCIGMGFAPRSNGVSLRTFNRNFKGRSGTKDAQVYIVSPETAAASALRGVITDPRDLDPIDRKSIAIDQPVDDRMIIPPGERRSTIEIVRGPNIQPCPLGVPLQDNFAASILLRTEDNITTDHIMPAGAAVLPLRSNIPEIAKYTFRSLDPGFYERALSIENGLIIGGENYGQGSSREHAALAPMFLGIRAVIAKSFARIHKANLINFGILPLTFRNKADYDHFSETTTVDFIDLNKQLTKGTEITVYINKKPFLLLHDCNSRQIDLLLSGGLLNYVKNKSGGIK